MQENTNVASLVDVRKRKGSVLGLLGLPKPLWDSGPQMLPEL